MPANSKNSAVLQRRFGTREIPLLPVGDYDADAVKALRHRLKVSQVTLASVMNVSISTVRHWELNLKHPSGAALKLLDLLNRKGIEGLA